MTIQPSKPNNRIKYAWFRYQQYPIAEAKRLSQRPEMPPEFFADFEKWFFYTNGQLRLDSSDGEDNIFAQRLENYVKNDPKTPETPLTRCAIIE